MKKYVLFYESADDVLAKAPLHFPAHHARWEGFRTAGTLLMVGTFANPQEGAMGIFTTQEAAEEFAKGDPFVLNGVVRHWYIRDWNEAIAVPSRRSKQFRSAANCLACGSSHFCARTGLAIRLEDAAEGLALLPHAGQAQGLRLARGLVEMSGYN